MPKKNFYRDPDNTCIIPKTLMQMKDFSTWNKDIPQHVKYYNESQDERNAITYLALFVETEFYRILPAFFPNYDSESFYSAIQLMKSVRLIPNQILDAAHNIRNIRNAITHNIQVKSFDELEGFKPNLIKTLIHITNTYQGDYDTYYERIEDTMKNRFKSTCMNVISALRYFEPSIKAVRGVLDSHQYQFLIKEEENPEFPNSDGIV